MRRITARALVLAFFIVSLAAAAAEASTVQRGANVLTYNASAGETNVLSVTFDAAAFGGQGGIVFTDAPGVTITPAGPACTPYPNPVALPSNRAVCEDTGITRVNVNLSDGNDVLTFGGGYTGIPTTANGGDGEDDISGTDAGDDLIGAGAVDTLNGEAGNDTLDGGGAGDSMSGGAGANDAATYEDAAEAVHVTLDGQENDGVNCAPGASDPCEGDNVGGTTNDVEDVIGGGGADTIIGQRTTDLNPLTANTFLGGDGNDTLIGNAGDDTLEGEADDDTLQGGLGNDALDGGDGSDTTSYADRSAASPVIVNLATCTPQCGAAGELDTLTAIENVTGGAGNDTLTGDDNGNVLNGNGGDDELDGAGDVSSADTLFGGPGGQDHANYSGRTGEDLTITLDGQANDGAEDLILGAEGDNVHPDVERVTTSTGDDSITGSSAANTFDAGAGNDVLDGAGGGDALNGAAGTADTVTYASRNAPVTVTLNSGANDGEAGEGDDVTGTERATGGAAGDTLTGDLGANTLNGGGGNDRLIGGAGADALNGGDGAEDEADYSQDVFRVTGVTVTLDLTGNDAGEADNVQTENVRGTLFADTLTGNPDGNDFFGLGGIDTMDGRGAADRLFGGDLGDTINGGSGDDFVEGGGGNDNLSDPSGSDTVSYADKSSAVTVTLGSTGVSGAESDTLGGGFENALGGSGNDTLLGEDDRTNRLEGGPGNDTLNGGATVVSDTLVGDSGTDTSDYSTRGGNLTVSLDNVANDGENNEKDNVDTENVTTGSGNDTLTGNSGVNVLTAGGGNDTVNVRDASADTANCGAGSDTANADNLDTLDACETSNVTQIPVPAAPPAPPSTPAPPSNPPTTPFVPTPPNPLAGPRRLPRTVTATVGPRRDRRTPYRFLVSGQLSMPAILNSFRTQVCAEGGIVSVQTKLGRRTVSTRRVRIDRDCSYDVTVTFRNRRRLLRTRRSARLKFTARFLGNRYLRPRAARSVFARVG
jgi:Ca2+-binding RTX toxin-like protein